MAHVNSDTKIPAKQGLLGIFEVFFDTIIMCTLTGFVILLANDGEFITDNGMLLVIYSFSKYYGKKAAYLISASILLFAFATVICWAYYGKTCLGYFTTSKKAERAYLAVYCAVTLIGAVMSQSMVWKLSRYFRRDYDCAQPFRRDLAAPGGSGGNGVRGSLSAEKINGAALTGSHFRNIAVLRFLLSII